MKSGKFVLSVITIFVATALVCPMISRAAAAVTTAPAAVLTEPTVTTVGDAQRVVNPPDGYQVDVPLGMKLDLRYSPAYVRVSSPALDVKISREYSAYEDFDMYLRDYAVRFIAREDYAHYRELNGIRLIDDAWEKINDRRVRIISFHRTPAPTSQEQQNDYLMAYIEAPNRFFYTLLFRTDSLMLQRATIRGILESFTLTKPQGTAQFALDLRPVPGNWNAETKAFYEHLTGGKEFMWGIFYPWAVTTTAGYSRVESIEQKLGFHFPLLLHYINVSDPFPLAGMRNAYDRGQIVELTMQVAEINNERTDYPNPNFDLLDGLMDDTIRRFARAAKTFEHPFLFRLNNEMNTDWTQYSGVRLLSDVDIYINVWRRVFNIFEQEGVDNAVWIFNPNQNSYPPMNWNHQVSYFPGNDYVHVIGLTGYNPGEYYRSFTGERWASFKQIYDPTVAEYRQLYGRFPWMITEFASSSVGGDKEQWITGMFETLASYPEIRAAVWWSYADYDSRPGKKGTPARLYWLDEREEYLKAFERGLKRQGLLARRGFWRD